jgi:hypothetical protein
MPPSGMSMQYHQVKEAADHASTVGDNLNETADQAEPGMITLPRTYPNWGTSGALTVVAPAHLDSIRETAAGLYLWHGQVYSSIAAVIAAENANSRTASSIGGDQWQA